MKKFLIIILVVITMIIGFGCTVKSNGSPKEPNELLFLGDIYGNRVYEFKDSQGREFILADGSHAVSITQIK